MEENRKFRTNSQDENQHKEDIYPRIETSSVISLRGHHLPNLREYVKDGVRLHFDERFGYTTTFAKAHDAILDAIVKNPEQTVRLVAGTDDICNCGVCPNKKPQCASPSVAERDRRVAVQYGLVADRDYQARELIEVATKPILDMKEVVLKTGEQLQIKMVTPPAGEYTEKILRFLEHKSDLSLRSIRQRLRGDYVGDCVDKYFVGEIEGRIVGQVWYGYSNSGIGIANFGEVYTEPEFRRRGIFTELMKVAQKDFSNAPVVAAFCTAVFEQVTSIFCRFGFQPIIQGVNYGPLALIKSGFGENFEAFTQVYYAPGKRVFSVSPGSMKHQYDIDTLLHFSFLLKRIQEESTPMKYIFSSGASISRRVCMSAHVTNYMDAYFGVEDGRGLVTVVTIENGNVIGWAFFLNTGSDFEQESKVFDFENHPGYPDSANRLVHNSLLFAQKNGVRRAYSYCISTEVEKISLLRDAGFQEVARLQGYLQINEQISDLVILCWNDTGKHIIHPPPTKSG